MYLFINISSVMLKKIQNYQLICKAVSGDYSLDEATVGSLIAGSVLTHSFQFLKAMMMFTLIDLPENRLCHASAFTFSSYVGWECGVIVLLKHPSSQIHFLCSRD